LESKYIESDHYFNGIALRGIIFGGNAALISIFKEHLLYDELSEFLNRFFPLEMSKNIIQSNG
jgi:hypothetical protein